MSNFPQIKNIGQFQEAVNARELHAFLEVGRDFSTWLSARLEQFPFISGVDFVTSSIPQNGGKGGRPVIEHYLSVGMAKELAMLERSDKGSQVRKYFIECEKRLNEKPVAPENPLLQLANAVLTAQKVIDDQSSRLALAEPKAAAFDLISEAEGELCLTDAAKHLQIKPCQLTKWLQVNGWIYKRAGSKSWVAYQQRIDQGLLIHRRATFTRTSGVEDYSWQALVTPKGISVLAKKESIRSIFL